MRLRHAAPDYPAAVDAGTVRREKARPEHGILPGLEIVSTTRRSVPTNRIQTTWFPETMGGDALADQSLRSTEDVPDSNLDGILIPVVPYNRRPVDRWSVQQITRLSEASEVGCVRSPEQLAPSTRTPGTRARRARRPFPCDAGDVFGDLKNRNWNLTAGVGFKP